MNIIVLELVLVAAVAFGIGFWQLYDINKELKKDREKAEQVGDQKTQRPTDHGRTTSHD